VGLYGHGIGLGPCCWENLPSEIGETRPHRRIGYALRRKSEARTRSRNCFAVSVGGAGTGFGFTTAGAAASAAFFAALRAASCASWLVAKSFASASTVSAGVPSRAMRTTQRCCLDATNI
jgi:hypothetical protein